ncbi:hypothetical protein R950_004359 [Salmonella enterica subsp. enterica]|nr:hypothetical protein [Salmonella enterica]EDW1643832.1 hypothetical protein [Salmonella enterica subsp. enterica serovar Baguida]EDW2262297.1 hypothetical protein [Salmonella enterica subsp. enterica serovar Langford]MIL26712.1 hypothetical protein [Salmonella enterica]
MNVACDGPSGRGPWMGRVIRSQHISNLKYEGYTYHFTYTHYILGHLGLVHYPIIKSSVCFFDLDNRFVSEDRNRWIVV